MGRENNSCFKLMSYIQLDEDSKAKVDELVKMLDESSSDIILDYVKNMQDNMTNSQNLLITDIVIEKREIPSEYLSVYKTIMTLYDNNGNFNIESSKKTVKELIKMVKMNKVSVDAIVDEIINVYACNIEIASQIRDKYKQISIAKYDYSKDLEVLLLAMEIVIKRIQNEKKRINNSDNKYQELFFRTELDEKESCLCQLYRNLYDSLELERTKSAEMLTQYQSISLSVNSDREKMCLLKSTYVSLLNQIMHSQDIDEIIKQNKELVKSLLEIIANNVEQVKKNGVPKSILKPFVNIGRNISITEAIKLTQDSLVLINYTNQMSDFSVEEKGSSPKEMKTIEDLILCHKEVLSNRH